jgi:NADPH2:quinone reductase
MAGGNRTGDGRDEMRAMVVTGFGEAAMLQEREVTAPEPAPGEVIIEVEYAAVGLLDVLVRRGELPDLVQPPFVPGLEVAGRIHSVGPDVTGLSVGEPVVTLSRPTGGGYAQLAVAAAELCIPLRGHDIDLALAVATVPNLVTAVGALSLAAHVAPGDSVLVLGAAGGLASVFPAVARSLGASRVVGVVSTAQKVDAAGRFGFDRVVLRDHLDEGQGRFDIVVDPVGGDLRRRSLALLNPLGRVLAVGNASGAADVLVGANELWLANAAVVGFNVGGLLMAQPHRAREFAERALELLAAGEVDIPIETLPLARAAEAHARLEARSVAGKLVLRL